MKKNLALSLTLLGFFFPATAFAAAIDSEKLIATTGCPAAGQNAADWDTFAECPSASGTWARGPLFPGATSDTCDSNHAGMLQWTGTVMEICTGSSWTAYGTGVSVALSALTAATAALTFDNASSANFFQTWTWNTLTTQNAFTLSSTSITSGSLLAVTAANTGVTGPVLSVSTASTGGGIAIEAAVTGASNTGSAGYFTNASTTGYGVYSAGISPNYFGGNVNIATGSSYKNGGNLILSDPKNDATSVEVGLGAGVTQTVTSSYNTYAGNAAGGAMTSGSDMTAIGQNALHAATSGSTYCAIGASSLYTVTTTSSDVGLGYQSGYYVKGADNTALGYQAMYGVSGSLLTGTTNVAVGNQALYLAKNAIAYDTAVGYQALYSITTGVNDTGMGMQALYGMTTGYDNSALGYHAGEYITTGNYNTCMGYQSMQGNSSNPITGSDNVAIGYQSLANAITTASYNTVIGYQSAYSNTSASNQTAVGYQALYSSTVLNNHTAIGYQALYNDAATTGNPNYAFGYLAGYHITTTADNNAFGYQALYSTSNTTLAATEAIGYAALELDTGADNVALGYEAGYAGNPNTTATNNTFIGYETQLNVTTNYTNGTAIGSSAVLTASNSIVLGNSLISAIYGQVSSITAISDRRLKKEIADLPSSLGLEFIGKLKPVSYRFNNGDETQRYGFIAQDMEAALPQKLQYVVENSKPEHGLALIERQNNKDRTYRVSYGELTASIVKAIQEQQTQIDVNHKDIARIGEPDRTASDQIDGIAARLQILRQHFLVYPAIGGLISFCLGFFLMRRRKG